LGHANSRWPIGKVQIVSGCIAILKLANEKGKIGEVRTSEGGPDEEGIMASLGGHAAAHLGHTGGKNAGNDRAEAKSVGTMVKVRRRKVKGREEGLDVSSANMGGG